MSGHVTTRITGLRTVGIPVRDQDRALEFYVRTLGLEKRTDAPVPQLGGRWIVVAPPESGATIALIPEREGVPAGVETGIRLGTADAEADHASLRAAGADVGELLRWEGVPPMFTLRDPDGNGLEIVEDSGIIPAAADAPRTPK
jgi:lactoylglutathione lyase